MSKRNSLENFALFYEKIEENAKSSNDTTEERQKISYDNSPCLTEDDLYKLNDDVRHPIQKSGKSDPIQS